MENRVHKLILCFIPTNQCNLKCEYCVVSQTREWERGDIRFRYPVERMVKGLRRERLGGTCYVNLTAQGETLLYRDIVPLTRGLLEEGHFVEIVTNGTVTKRIDEILAFPPALLGRLFFKISYHYEQLKRLHIEKRYWENVKKIKASPCSFTVELMPHDQIAGEVDALCARCREGAGAVCHATVGRDDRHSGKDLLTAMPPEEYAKTWSRLDSPMFAFKMALYGKKRREFCYAGAWSLLVDLSSGEAAQCYGRMNTQNIFEDLDRPIRFHPVGYTCTQAFCFNGHAHLAWGMIPELETPSYYEIRDRACEDGSHWVKGECEAVFRQKLRESNQSYTALQKAGHAAASPLFLFGSLFHDVPGLKRKLKKFYKIAAGKF